MKRNKLTLTLFSVILLMGSASVLTSCNNDDNQSKNQEDQRQPETLSNHVWITTEVSDQTGRVLNNNTQPASDYVGYAYYKTDGTFRIVDFNDRPRIFGTWELTDNNTKRLLRVYNTENTIAYERSVDIITLRNNLFTYRIVPNADNSSVFYNVAHRPVTDHPEPNTPAQVLASVNWTTTKVLDITNGEENATELDRNTIPASNFSGDAYYVNNHGNEYFPKNADDEFANGTFEITNYGNRESVRARGDWYVSLNGRAVNRKKC